MASRYVTRNEPILRSLLKPHFSRPNVRLITPMRELLEQLMVSRNLADRCVLLKMLTHSLCPPRIPRSRSSYPSDQRIVP
jgi:hypothetical protein